MQDQFLLITTLIKMALAPWRDLWWVGLFLYLFIAGVALLLVRFLIVVPRQLKSFNNRLAGATVLHVGDGAVPGAEKQRRERETDAEPAWRLDASAS